MVMLTVVNGSATSCFFSGGRHMYSLRYVPISVCCEEAPPQIVPLLLCSWRVPPLLVFTVTIACYAYACVLNRVSVCRMVLLPPTNKVCCSNTVLHCIFMRHAVATCANIYAYVAGVCSWR
jgi:hypothetical protein